MTLKLLKPGEGEIITLLGEPRTFKMTPAENGGAYLQFETSTAPGTGAPLHLHVEEDEAFYVLAGTYEFTVEKQTFRATTGAFAFVPRGTVHGFSNVGQDMARMLITVTPGTQHEGLFREVGELTRRLGTQPEPAQLIALASRYGWKMGAQTHNKES